MTFYAGRLGTPVRSSTTDAVEAYQVPTGQYAILNVSLCNTTLTAVRVRLAITANSTPDDKDWLEYDTIIIPNGVFERTSLMVQAGRRVFVRADTANAISISCYGLLIDTEVISTEQTGSIAPLPAPTTLTNGISNGYGTSTSLWSSSPIVWNSGSPAAVGDISLQIFFNGTAGAITVTPPSGWVELVDQGASPNLEASYRVLDAADLLGPIRQWTFSGTAAPVSSIQMAVRGSSSGFAGALSTTITGSGTLTIPAVVNPVANCLNLLIISMYDVDRFTISTPPSGWTLFGRSNNGGSPRIETVIFSRVSSLAGDTGTTVYTVPTGATGPSVGVRLSFRPTGS